MTAPAYLHDPRAADPAPAADIPPFVVTRGGEYFFVPGLRALRWLAELKHGHGERIIRGDRVTTPTETTVGTRSTSVRLRRVPTNPIDPCCSSTEPTVGIAVITLNRPHADNAITTEMGASLTEMLEKIAVRPAVRVGDHDRCRRSRFLGRQRSQAAQEHDQRGVASPAPGLRSHPVHAPGAENADLRCRQRDCLRRWIGDRPEHRLHHRRGERDVRSARSHDRPVRRWRIASSSRGFCLPARRCRC